MAKQVLLYTSIYSYVAADFIKNVDDAKSQDLEIRMNTSGGSPEDAWGMIAKLQAHTGKKTVKVDGRAYSMGAFILAYCDDVECLDVSDFLIHRAGYSEYLEASLDFMTTDVWENLNRINGFLRQALEAKIDVNKFKQVTGYTLDQVFSTEGRLDVSINAEQAVEIGLVNRIVKITPDKKKELAVIAAEFNGIRPKQSTAVPAPVAEVKPTQTPTKKYTNMTIEQLKAEHQAVYQAAFKEGVEQERDRVGAHLAFIDVDSENVIKGIKEGSALSSTAMAEYTVKAIAKGHLGNVSADSAAAVKTGEQPTTTAGKKDDPQVEAFSKAVDVNLGFGAKQ